MTVGLDVVTVEVVEGVVVIVYEVGVPPLEAAEKETEAAPLLYAREVPTSVALTVGASGTSMIF